MTQQNNPNPTKEAVGSKPLWQQIQDLLPHTHKHLSKEILDLFKPLWIERVGKMQQQIHKLEQENQLLRIAPTKEETLEYLKYHSPDNPHQFLEQFWVNRVDRVKKKLS